MKRVDAPADTGPESQTESITWKKPRRQSPLWPEIAALSAQYLCHSESRNLAKHPEYVIKPANKGLQKLTFLRWIKPCSQTLKPDFGFERTDSQELSRDLLNVANPWSLITQER